MRSAIGGVLSKSLPDGKNFFEAIKLIFEIKSKYVDLTISIGLPFTVHLATWLAIKSNRLETTYAVADYGDPYSTNPVSKKPFYARGLERIILKEFNYVTVPIESSAVAYENILVPAGKIKVIPQGFDLEADYSKNYKKNPIPSFAFAGALYKKIRDPSAFLDFLSKIERDYVFHIYTDLSNSHTISILEPYISELAGRMKLHAKIPRDECLEILSRMDFLINFSNATSIQAPSKIVDYVLSSRPFITICQENFDMNEFIAFLNNDFTSFVEPNISQYNEINVARKFAQLASPDAPKKGDSVKNVFS
ncbi:hypothetical protein CFI10_15790 [Marinobacterium iners]|nr:hypothetical protein CFI10_15790 [Marinobacterium iners]